MEGLLGLLVFVLSAQACLCCSPSIGQVGIPVTVQESDLHFTAALVDAYNPNEVFCSGTLISSTLIVTSKYCIAEKSEIVAFFGITSYPPLGDDNNGVLTRSFTRDDIQFSPLSLEDSTSIALLRTSEPIEINDFVKPIALASRYMIASLPGSDAITSFWTLQRPQTLNSAIVEILSVHYRGDRGPITGNDGSIALKLDGVNDSGAPLYVIDSSGIPRLVGIKSNKDSDDVDSSLQSYILIDNYLDWLLIEILKDCADA